LPEPSARARRRQGGDRPESSTVTAFVGSVLAGRRFGGGRASRGGFWVGGGGGVEHWSLTRSGGVTAANNAPVFQCLGGLELFFGARWSGFAEYRFATARHAFNFGTARDEWRNNLSFVTGGVALHF